MQFFVKKKLEKLKTASKKIKNEKIKYKFMRLFLVKTFLEKKISTPKFLHFVLHENVSLYFLFPILLPIRTFFFILFLMLFCTDCFFIFSFILEEDVINVHSGKFSVVPFLVLVSKR